MGLDRTRRAARKEDGWIDQCEGGARDVDQREVLKKTYLHVVNWLGWGVHHTEWDDTFCCLQPTVRPYIPYHSHRIDLLELDELCSSPCHNTYSAVAVPYTFEIIEEGFK